MGHFGVDNRITLVLICVSMNTLELAIKAEGSVKALAKSLGVAQNVVSNWRSRDRLPRPWSLVLEYKYPSKTKKSKVKATEEKAV